MGKGGKNESGDKLDDEIDVLLASLSDIQVRNQPPLRSPFAGHHALGAGL